jgi:hypothetical protein
MNTKEYGQTLEYYIAQKLIDLGLDEFARPSKNSGGSTELGDVLNSQIHVEAKKRNTKSITIHEAVWDKMILQLPIDSKKIPCYALENNNNRRWMLLDLDMFFDLLKKAQENEN